MSDQVHHLSMGAWVVVLSYAIAVIGLYVGIACARRAVHSTERRWYWIVLAAMVIGGDTYWLANLVTMAGFEVDGSLVRFHQLGVVASLLVCMAAVLAGLYINGPRPTDGGERGDRATVRMLVAAVVTGLGLTVGYYVAMLSIQVQGRIWLDGALTAVAGVIAVVASIGVLWLCSADVSRLVLGGGAVLIAAAPVLMHLALMAALRVRVDPTQAVPAGGGVFTILFPAFVGSMLILIVPIIALLMAPDRVTAELEAQARAFDRQRAEHSY